MSALTDNIVIIWLIPVLLQIVLPLAILIFYVPFRTIKNLRIASSNRTGATYEEKPAGA